MSEIPEKFLGKFKVENSENFDAYLASKNVSWFLRKLICLTPVTKVFEKSSTQPGHYNMHNLSSKENTLYENFALNEQFESKGLDGTKHKIKFGLINDNVLTESHIRFENGDEKEEIYQYSIEGEKLVLKLENESVVCRRFFKKISN